MTERWPRWATVAVAVLAVIAAGLAIAVLIEPGPLPGDLAILRWWQRRGEPVPTIAEWVRLTTGTEATLIVAIIPAWLVISRYGRAGVMAVAIVAVAMLVVQPAVKSVIDRPRPSGAEVDVRAVHTSMSFPSGHSMSTIAFWGVVVLVLVFLRRPLLAAVTCVPIVLTSQASLVQGVHWPSDSLAGLALGGIAAIVAAVILRNAELRWDGDGLRHAGRRRPAQGGDP